MSPSIRAADFYIWEAMKVLVCRYNPCYLCHVKEATVNFIPHAELVRFHHKNKQQ
jgi:hypothetical protein